MPHIYELLSLYVKNVIAITDCVFRKLFAFFANRLRFSQKGVRMPQNTTKKHFSKHIVHNAFYSEDRKKWAWQIGNEQYCERHFSSSRAQSEIDSQSVLQKYAIFDKKFQTTSLFEKVIWQRDKNNGYIGRYGDYEFWISPINQVQSGLWRYDIYHSVDTKSICYGVAQSIVHAQFACVRFAVTIKI